MISKRILSLVLIICIVFSVSAYSHRNSCHRQRHRPHKVRKTYANITLIAGDVDGDGLVNGKDVQEVRLAGNINHNVSDAANALADVDGDGLINGKDVQTIRLVTNINKGTTDCTFAY